MVSFILDDTTIRPLHKRLMIQIPSNDPSYQAIQKRSSIERGKNEKSKENENEFPGPSIKYD